MSFEFPAFIAPDTTEPFSTYTPVPDVPLIVTGKSILALLFPYTPTELVLRFKVPAFVIFPAPVPLSAIPVPVPVRFIVPPAPLNPAFVPAAYTPVPVVTFIVPVFIPVLVPVPLNTAIPIALSVVIVELFLAVAVAAAAPSATIPTVPEPAPVRFIVPLLSAVPLST